MQLAFFGLGVMGRPMAKHLAAQLALQGQRLGIWNRTARVTELFLAEAFLADKANIYSAEVETLAAEADIIFLCVKDDAAVKNLVQVIEKNGKAGSIVVDHSTTHPDTARACAKILQGRGIRFIDAPISGGREGAEQGQLVAMLGGEASAIAEVTPWLASYCKKVFHLGAVGQGQALKAVNQIMVAGINQAVAESLALAQTLGLPQESLSILQGGAAGNWFLEKRGGSIWEGKFAPGFKLALHYKDLQICQQLLHTLGLESVVVEKTLADYQGLLAEHGEEDISVLFLAKQKS